MENMMLDKSAAKLDLMDRYVHTRFSFCRPPNYTYKSALMIDPTALLLLLLLLLLCSPNFLTTRNTP